jgi:hypothetical protein
VLYGDRHVVHREVKVGRIFHIGVQRRGRAPSCGATEELVQRHTRVLPWLRGQLGLSSRHACWLLVAPHLDDRFLEHGVSVSPHVDGGRP